MVDLCCLWVLLSFLIIYILYEATGLLYVRTQCPCCGILNRVRLWKLRSRFFERARDHCIACHYAPFIREARAYYLEEQFKISHGFIKEGD